MIDPDAGELVCDLCGHRADLPEHGLPDSQWSCRRLGARVLHFCCVECSERWNVEARRASAGRTA